jgi:hypothetical protein
VDEISEDRIKTGKQKNQTYSIQIHMEAVLSRFREWRNAMRQGQNTKWKAKNGKNRKISI